ncbi:MAG: heavy metal-binding domain-containing protein [Pseudomonas sp.]|uniref:YbjQ family protein n=1 Tax=Pseudomonas sp. TaxID=306 RepID=UPI00339408E8
MGLLIQFIVFLGLLLIGRYFGRRAEQRHYRHLTLNEAALRHISLSSERHPSNDQPIVRGQLVVGSVVIADDYFKRLLALIRSFFGGRLNSYDSLIERGRREACLRMQAQAQRLGASQIINVRFETVSLNEGSAQRQSTFCAEFLAYGTALTSEQPQ